MNAGWSIAVVYSVLFPSKVPYYFQVRDYIYYIYK